MTDFARAQEIFADALERNDAERRSFVSSECGDDRELEREVLELLGALEEPVSLVDRPAIERLSLDAAVADAPARVDVGARIGPYRLTREIGAGGMGLVYEAEQEEPVRRRVALKLIKPGLDSREVTRRFEMERQTLFSLEHPHIARAYDAGVTDRGRPYFVMERVDGVPITDDCDRRELGLDERLRLFVQLCRAVQFAHLRGVIHRDLKPSNVLVAEEPGGPVPKVIDFGIAKALAADGQEETLTRHAQPIGTPETMSPEQALGRNVDIRTDVYSAGALLYRLLCGRYPFSNEELRSSDWGAVQRVLAETEPAAPSVRARREGEAAPGVDRQRLQRDRELDWITLRALAKDPGRRYQSMEELAADIERYLGGEAVEAGPESWSYRARKFVGRHRAGVAAATLVVALVFGAALALALQAARLRAALEVADQERSEAEQVTGLLGGILAGADPFAEGRRDVTALELLERGERSVRESLAEQPAVRAELLQVIGTARHNLGDDERAAELLEEAVAARRSQGDPAELSKALGALTLVRNTQSRFEEGDALSEEAVTAARESGDAEALVQALQTRGETLRQVGRLEDAEAVYTEALAEGVDAVPERLLRRVRHSRALLWGRLGRVEEALAEATDLLDAEVERPTSAGQAASLRAVIGALLIDLGRSGEALPHLRAALEEQAEVLGEANSRTLATRANLALAANNVGDLELARDMNLESLRALRRGASGPQAHEALLLNNLGLNQHGLGDLEGAEASFREALAVQRAVVGDDHPNLAFHLSNLARVLQETGRSEEGEDLYRRALALRRKHLPPDHPNVADTEVWLGALLLETGRAKEARGHLERGVEIREAALDPQGWQAAEARSWLGACLVALGETEEGLPMVVDAYPVIRERRGDHWWRTPAALERVIAAYQAAGEEGRAAEARRLFAERHRDRADG